MRSKLINMFKNYKNNLRIGLLIKILNKFFFIPKVKWGIVNQSLSRNFWESVVND